MRIRGTGIRFIGKEMKSQGTEMKSQGTEMTIRGRGMKIRGTVIRFRDKGTRIRELAPDTGGKAREGGAPCVEISSASPRHLDPQFVTRRRRISGELSGVRRMARAQAVLAGARLEALECGAAARLRPFHRARRGHGRWHAVRAVGAGAGEVVGAAALETGQLGAAVALQFRPPLLMLLSAHELLLPPLLLLEQAKTATATPSNVPTPRDCLPHRRDVSTWPPSARTAATTLSALPADHNRSLRRGHGPESIASDGTHRSHLVASWQTASSLYPSGSRTNAA
jgi:hypothetical protein